MRLAKIDNDHWELRSRASEEVEVSIPQELLVGHSVKLIFEMELLGETGELIKAVEFMWVAVTERIGDVYVGLLEIEPHFLSLSEDSILVPFMEVPFLQDHIVDYILREEEFRVWIMTVEPARHWPREYQ